MSRRSRPKRVKIPPLMEVDLSPPDGYPKLPKWDPTRKYRLKNPSKFSFPPYRAGKTAEYLNSFPQMEEEPSENQERDQVIPIRYKQFSESPDTSESPSPESPVFYLNKYLEIKRTKALLLAKIREDDRKSLEASLVNEDPELLDQTDFMLEDSVEIESFSSSSIRFRNQYSSGLTRRRISENVDLNSLTKKLEEYFI